MFPTDMTVQGNAWVLRMRRLYSALRRLITAPYRKESADSAAPRRRDFLRPYITSVTYDLTRDKEPADSIDRLFCGSRIGLDNAERPFAHPFCPFRFGQEAVEL